MLPFFPLLAFQSKFKLIYHLKSFNIMKFFRVFFMNKYGYSDAKANVVSSLVYTISCIASPVCGFFVDKFGRNIFFVFLAILISLGCHVLLAFSYFNPFAIMVCMLCLKEILIILRNLSTVYLRNWIFPVG